MTVLQTIILAIVEGLTEFLPVSSTGHMIITQGLLGIESTPFVKAFTIIIQFGAILSVVCLYWKRFFRLNTSPAPEGSNALQILLHKFRFYWLLIVGVIPAVIIGFAAKKSGLLDWLLDSVWVVAVMLVVGGVFMLFCDKLFNSKDNEKNEVDEHRAFKIGLFQCLSVIPGVSRSMATIVGGMASGLSRKRSAEFSFFLAVPTMAGATLLDVLDLLKGDATWATGHNVFLLLVGCAVSFVVALFAMKWFVAFLTKYGFKAFGWYRIIVGGIILIMLLSGASLNMIG